MSNTVIDLEMPSPFLIPAEPLRIVLVGCGGTGSHLAEALAKIAYDARSRRKDVRLVFVDGDIVERKNIGRQKFAAPEIGRNKALTLAARFSRLFSLDIIGIPHMLTELRENRFADNTQRYTVWVGAVDNAAARRDIEDRRGATGLWLDCGNHQNAGQVMVGNASVAELQGALYMKGVARTIPSPMAQRPQLALDESAEQLAQDCAEAMIEGDQSLTVNHWMACIAEEYLNDIVLRGRLTHFQTVTDLTTKSTRSIPITGSTIAQETGCTIDHLTKPPRRAWERTTFAQ